MSQSRKLSSLGFQLPASLTTVHIHIHLLLLLLIAVANSCTGSPSVVAGRRHAAYFGTPIGRLTGRSNNVSGLVYAVDDQTLFIRDFNYDGQAPDAYFWSSVQSKQPTGDNGFIVPDEKGSTKPLEAYTSKELVLRLPEGKTLSEIQWLSVWSRERRSSLGEILLAGRQLNTPRPLEIAPLTEVSHATRSAPITIVDAQTLLVPDLHYDGLAPDAYFWLTRGAKGLSAKDGLKLRDENGSLSPLRKYTGETVVVTLPDEFTVHDFDYFGIWCDKHQVVLGETRFPAAARVPPSPKMLGIKPENKLNCEILHDELGFEIRWVLDGDDIVMQLVGKIEPDEYMAFGLGKDDSSSKMEKADAVVAWVDRRNGQVHALDYYLGSKSQCSSDFKGTCADAKIPGASDSLTLLHGAIVNGFSMVTFKRPQLGVDEQYDQHVYSDGQQSVLWAIGPLNERREPGYHRLRTRQNMFIDFARNPQWNCPTPDLNASMHSQKLASESVESLTISDPSTPLQPAPTAESAPEPTSQSAPVAVATEQSMISATQAPAPFVAPQTLLDQQRTTSTPTPTPPTTTTQPTTTTELPAWFVPGLVCPDEHTLYAQLGPTGGSRGFEAITGLPAWGVAWYINGLMAPELVLERGQSYRFVVEGGNDKTSVAGRHPLYLTDSHEGGFDFKTDEQRLKERTFAGVGMRPDGLLVPTAEGRLCEWRPTNNTLAEPDQYPSFAAYRRTLRLECIPGQASVLKFSPDLTWPDQLYYQCYTHRFMGWRIRLVDSCAAHLSGLRPSSTVNKSNKFKTTRRRRSEPQKADYKRRLSINLADLEPDMEHDMLLLNSSILHQTNQPALNMSALEELMRVWPQAVEFADGTYSLQPPAPSPPVMRQPISGPDTALEAAFVETQFGQLLPIELHNLTAASQLFQSMHLNQLNQTSRLISNNRATLLPPPPPPPTTTTAKPAKNGIQGYVKRLASFYYPVHQQLASILQPSIIQSPTVQPLQHSSSNQHQLHIFQLHPQQQTSPSTQGGSSFSLSSLVPMPKIDLSKSSISKKLNKLRFKSKTETSAGEPLKQPPKPSIEFNYHIFNNQLAELEKQNKQLQTLESLINWQQEAAPMSFNGLSLFPPTRLEQVQPDFMSEPPFNGFMKNGSQFNRPPIELAPYTPFSTQPAIFVSRIPSQPISLAPFTSASPPPLLMNHLNWQQHPTTQQITSTSQPVSKPMSSKPSVVHESRFPGERIVQPQQPNTVESNGESVAEPDQVAIERYSKQASDRLAGTIIRPPSAHQWLQQNLSANSNFNSTGNSWHAPGLRFSMPLKQFPDISNEFLQDVPDLNRLNNASRLMNHQPIAAESELVQSFNWLLHPTTPASNVLSIEPASQTTSLQSTVWPLFPSVGPPVRNQTSTTTSEPVLTSNLLEPPSLTSTLVSNTKPSNLQPPTYLNSINQDHSTFTPLELSSTSNSMAQHYGFPLRAPISPHSHPYLTSTVYGPQPPVQVASYLAQRFVKHKPNYGKLMVLASQQQQPATEPRFSFSSDSMASHKSPQLPATTTDEENKLILLRPALAQTGSQSNKLRKMHTYPLQVEYLRGKPIQPAGNSLTESQQTVAAGPNARRLAGFQFERLSSLSSAPSTSFSFVEPMHTSTSQHVSTVKQVASNASTTATTSANSQQLEQPFSEPQVSQQSSSQQQQQLLLLQPALEQPQHRKSLSKQIPFSVVEPTRAVNSSEAKLSTSSSLSSPTFDDTYRLFNRDNSTDNAILSHVMSLIQSNAIPSPPLVSVSDYSNSDYFNSLASDRNTRSLPRSLHRLLDFVEVV